MEKITSVKNKKVKAWKKLHSAKGRKETGTYLLEGEHLYEEAKKAGAPLLEVIVSEYYLEKRKAYVDSFLSEQLVLVTDEVMKVISQTQTSQGILCVLELPPNQMPTSLEGKMVLLDGVQDPGNAGTIVRTADAAGFQGVVFGTGSVDPYNDKVLRSMQGSHFHLPIYQCDLMPLLEEYARQSLPVFGTALDERSKDYRSVKTTDSLALILGNEGNGVSESVLEKTSQNLYIPIIGKAESLNVSVAAGILIYHFL